MYDRKRSLELFNFEYVLEMYKPVDKRRWGFFALSDRPRRPGHR